MGGPVLESLRHTGLTDNLKKCAFGWKEVQYLEYWGMGALRWTKHWPMSQDQERSEAVLSVGIPCSTCLTSPSLLLCSWMPQTEGWGQNLSEREPRYSMGVSGNPVGGCLFFYYLLRHSFILYLDHGLLQWLHRMKDANLVISGLTAI